MFISVLEGNVHNLHDFVQEVVDLVTDKLQIFWKLSQIYSSSATNLTSFDRENDINVSFLTRNLFCCSCSKWAPSYGFNKLRREYNWFCISSFFKFKQMLISTINVSSWLMLNALVPSSLPESVMGKYSERFAKWPPMSSSSLKHQLFAALKILR